VTHPELCELTARWAIKKKRAKVVLWEYQNLITGEFPDVLTFGSFDTTLYEIKMSRADFLADAKKDSRVRYRIKHYESLHMQTERIRDDENGGYLRIGKREVLKLKSIQRSTWPELQAFRSERPHLGAHRYFVCMDGLILKNEVYHGWGLIYFKEGKFRVVQQSQRFRANVHAERNLAAHALYLYAGGVTQNIIVKAFDRVTATENSLEVKRDNADQLSLLEEV